MERSSMNEEGSPTIPRAFSSSGGEGSDCTDLVDLAAERLGGSILIANDEFFAPKENLLKAGEAVWKEGVYTDVGKWMDGWETRRRREPGHDWCIVRLGLPGALRGVIVDTAYFRGNYPESCSLEACAVEGYPTPEELTAAPWGRGLPRRRGCRRRRGSRSPPAPRWKGTRRTVFRSSARPGRSPTCASTSIRTAASPGCGFSARWLRAGGGSPGTAARWTSRRPRTAGSCSPAATCSSAIATT